MNAMMQKKDADDESLAFVVMIQRTAEPGCVDVTLIFPELQLE
jgi:hypothetical protein